jgi:hypothetical protein
MSQEDTRAVDEDKDGFLQFLVNRVNGTTVEIAITLHVQGLLVSGTLVSGDIYFEHFGEQIAAAKADDKETAESHRAAFAKLAEQYNGEGTQEKYIHLKNARFHSPGANPVPTNSEVWWRGRISEVSAFFLGVLGSAE